MRLSLLFLLFSLSLPGQTLRVDEEYSIERLIREVFLSGQCTDIRNIESIGSNAQATAYFENGNAGVGFGRGIIISTGQAALAPGPNSASDAGYIHSTRASTDEDLSLVSTGVLYDRAGIEFDFVPQNSTISFRYVFASEEYCDFVGDDFNDVFGFFVSGPGIDGPYHNGAENIARIPGSEEAVSINTINYAANSSFYLDNEFPSVRLVNGCGGPNEAGPRFELIEYDGQTVVMEASIEVIPCRTYHLRMVIGDVKDQQWDSAVFLEAGSFNLGGSVTLENSAGTKDPILVTEGCAGEQFIVRRGEGGNRNVEQTISYRIAGSSSAGSEDLDLGSGTVTIPAGEDAVAVPIQAPDDGRVENQEEAWVFLDIPCACYTDSVLVLIQDLQPLFIGLDTAYYCPGRPTRLNPGILGGQGPFTYNWSFGSTEAMPERPSPLASGFELTVTDACGQTAEKTIASAATRPPTVLAGARDLEGCQGDTLNIDLRLSGQGPFILHYTVDGAERQTFLSADTVQHWPIFETGRYHLYEVYDQACGTMVDTGFNVNLIAPYLSIRVAEPSCAGYTDGEIVIDHALTSGPYHYEYTNLRGSGPVFSRLPAGSYGARVIDGRGCMDTATITLEEPAGIIAPRISCEELRNPPLTISATGGKPPYRYSIDGLNYLGQDLFSTLNPGNFYTLRIRDSLGCERIADNFYWPVTGTPSAALPATMNREIASEEPVTVNYLVPSTQIANYRWYPAVLFSCPTCPEPLLRANSSQPISLVMEDIFGCRDSLVSQLRTGVSVPVYVPTAFSPNADGINDRLMLFAKPLQVERIVKFEVFTRWGGLVFREEDVSPEDLSRGWDGRIGSRAAASDVYVWIAEVRLVDQTLQTGSGTFVLMR